MKRRKGSKGSKLFSLILAAALVLSMSGTMTFAEETDYDVSATSEIQEDVAYDDIAIEPDGDEVQAEDVYESESEETYADEADGSNLPDPLSYKGSSASGVTASVTGEEPTRPEYVFAGRAEDPEATEAEYLAGTEYKLTVSITSDLTNNSKTYDGKQVTLTATPVISPENDDVTYTYWWYGPDGEMIENATGAEMVFNGNVYDSGTYKCIVTANIEGEAYTGEASVDITIKEAKQDISYEADEVSKYNFDEPFINELTETLVFGKITYTITSDPTLGGDADVEIDQETGEVTIHGGTGVLIITATAAGSNNYDEASATYTLTINSDVIEYEIDVDHVQMKWDDNKHEWVDDTIYTGDPLELEMVITLDEKEQAEVGSITYQWYVFDDDLNSYQIIDGATGDAYTLSGEDVNVGGYIYMCVATVNYLNGYSHTVYGAIGVDIEKAVQSLVFTEETVEATVGDTVTNAFTDDSVIYGVVTYSSSDENVAIVDPDTGEVTIVGVGTATITATAAGSTNYEGAAAEYTVTTADEVTVTIDPESVSKTYDGSEVTVTAEASSNVSDADISYEWTDKDGNVVGDNAELTIEGNVADSGEYTCTVTVTYPNGADDAVVNATVNVEITKADQEMSFEDPTVSKRTDDDPFTNPLTGAVNDVTYSSSDESVAAVDPTTGEVTIVGPGEATITATAEGDDNYNVGEASFTIDVAEVLTVDVTVTSDIEDDGNTKTYDGDGVILTAQATCSNDNAELTYQWCGPDGNAIDGANSATLELTGNVSDSGAYRCVVTATLEGAIDGSGEAEIEITIDVADQDISYAANSVTKYDYDESFVNELTKTLVFGDITYTILPDPSLGGDAEATIDTSTGEVIIIGGTGVLIITATAAGSENYTEASSTYTLTINSDAIEYEIDVDHDQMTWDDDKQEWVDDLTYTGDPLELEMVITLDEEEQAEMKSITYQWYVFDVDSGSYQIIDGATGDAYTLSGEDVNAGDCIYMCVATVNYLNGYSHTVYGAIEVDIGKADQSLAFTEETVEATVGDTVTNAFTDDSVIYGDVTYNSSDESVSVVDPDTGEVTIVGVGTATITATAAGTTNYEEATAEYTVTTADEVTVTIDPESVSKTYDGSTVTVTAEASSNVSDADISYEWTDKDGNVVGNDAELTLEGNVADTGKYTCTVTVTYPNDADDAVVTATVDVEITKAKQDISYEADAVSKYDFDEPFINELTETLVFDEITYTIAPDDTLGGDADAEIDPETGEVTIHGGTGVLIITATAAGSENYTEASDYYTLTINTDDIEYEIDVNNQQMTWDEDKGEWVDDLTYTGDPLELEMVITLTDEEQGEVDEITYQWHVFDDDSGSYQIIDGATGEAYTLSGDDVNAGEYVYMCVATVNYVNGYSHTVYGAIEVNIEKADQSLAFTEETVEATVGDTVTNEFTDDSVIVGEVTYSSSNEKVAAVDPTTGVVTIVGPGEATITATAAETTNYNEASAEYTISATDEISLTIDPESVSITYDGSEVTVKAQASSGVSGAMFTYVWTDEDGNVAGTGAELTLDGYVADSGTYTCTVTVDYPNGATDTVSSKVEVTISKAAQDMSFEEDAVSKTTDDEPFTNPLTGAVGDVTYTSSDESVAIVDEDGNVTIIGAGTATITASAAGDENYEAGEASFTIVVTEAAGEETPTLTATINGGEDVSKTYDGSTTELTVETTIIPDVAGDVTYTYQWTKDGEVIDGATDATLTLNGDVDDSGTYSCIVTAALSDGTTITATAGDITVDISKAAQNPSFSDGSTVTKSESDEPFTNPLAGDVYGDVTYISSDESVAIVDPVTGEVTIIGPGTATITAVIAGDENHEGVEISYTLTVTKDDSDSGNGGNGGNGSNTKRDEITGPGPVQNPDTGNGGTGGTGGTGSTGGTGGTSGTSGTGTTGAGTADTNAPILYMLLIVMAGAAIVTVGVRRRTVRR